MEKITTIMVYGSDRDWLESLKRKYNLKTMADVLRKIKLEISDEENENN